MVSILGGNTCVLGLYLVDYNSFSVTCLVWWIHHNTDIHEKLHFFDWLKIVRYLLINTNKLHSWVRIQLKDKFWWHTLRLVNTVNLSAISLWISCECVSFMYMLWKINNMISHMISNCKFFKYFKLHTRYELNICYLWKIYFCLFRIPK